MDTSHGEDDDDDDTVLCFVVAAPFHHTSYWDHQHPSQCTRTTGTSLCLSGATLFSGVCDSKLLSILILIDMRATTDEIRVHILFIVWPSCEDALSFMLFGFGYNIHRNTSTDTRINHMQKPNDMRGERRQYQPPWVQHTKYGEICGRQSILYVRCYFIRIQGQQRQRGREIIAVTCSAIRVTAKKKRGQLACLA